MFFLKLKIESYNTSHYLSINKLKLSHIFFYQPTPI